MTVIMRSQPIFLMVSSFIISFFLLTPVFSSTAGTIDGYTINGLVKIPGVRAKGIDLPGKLSDVKVILNGGKRVSFLSTDGYFSFNDVPAGTHLIEVNAIGYFFSPVRVDVSARCSGKVKATLTENRKGLNELVLEPLREENYFEIRKRFSIMSVVKSQLGLMIGVVIFVMFVMPKMIENIDPEDVKRGHEEMRKKGVPFYSLIPGGERS